MKRILVPTDFSKCAGKAMSYALEIALHTKAEILCLHSISPYEGVDVDGSGLLWVREYQEAKAKTLNTWVKKFKRDARFKELNITTKCNIGFTVTDIKESAKSFNADIIVMGTTGATGVGGMLFGSVAGGVISATTTPTFLVPVSAKFDILNNFALATDFQNQCSKESIEVMNDLLNAHKQSTLKVVHVLPEKAKNPPTQKEKDMQQKMKGINLEFTYMHDENVPRAINNFLDVSKTKVLCVISHHHGYLHKLFKGSTTKKLAFQAHTPMLVLFD